MFDFLKRRKAESAKREAIEIGSASVERINAGLSSWRATSLEMRRTMIEDFFAERLVEIVPEDDLSFEELAEIEALAAMKNWFEALSESVVPESDKFVSQEDREIMGVMGIESEIDHQLNRHVQEVSAILEQNINEMIDEAVRRHGDEPTPRD